MPNSPGLGPNSPHHPDATKTIIQRAPRKLEIWIAILDEITSISKRMGEQESSHYFTAHCPRTFSLPKPSREVSATLV